MDHLRLMGNGAHSKYQLLIQNIHNRKHIMLSDEAKRNLALHRKLKQLAFFSYFLDKGMNFTVTTV